MKRSAVVMLVLIGAAYMLLTTGVAQSEAPRGIYVQGTGTVYAEPDVAAVEVGVDLREQDVREVVSRATEAMNAVLAALQAAGVEERDIQTVQFSLYREERYNRDDLPELLGYRVRNVVRVTVRDMANTGGVIASAVEAGANVVGSIRFAVSEPEALVAQAREDAVADARAKAEQLAAAAGVGLGRLEQLMESTAPMPVAMDAMMMRAEMVAPVPVAPGELAVSVTVSLRYAIADE
jgi:uncharacterized protein YggE